MKVTLAYAERQLRHWTKKVAELRLTSNAFDGERKEDEKRDIPPTPPIERKEEEKKDSTYRAREEGDLVLVSELVETEADKQKRLKAEAAQRVLIAEKLFDAFWESYPRKVDKKECREKYVKILTKDNRFKTTEEMVAFHKKILSGLEKWKSSRDWVDGYICDPSRFLNNERWEECPVKTAKSVAKPEFRRVNPDGPNPMGLRNFIGADDSIKEKIQQIEEAKK